MPLLARYNKSLLIDQYKKLPDAVKSALFSTASAAKMLEIGKKYGLQMEEISYMAEETGYALLGLTKPAQFTEIIKTRLHIPQEKGEKIAEEITSAIFLPLQQALQEMPIEEKGKEPTPVQEDISHFPIPPIPQNPPLPPPPTTPASQIPPISSKPFRPNPLPESIPPSKIPPIDLRRPEISAPQESLLAPLINTPFPPGSSETEAQRSASLQNPTSPSQSSSPATPALIPKRPAPPPLPYENTPGGKPVYKDVDPYREIVE